MYYRPIKIILDFIYVPFKTTLKSAKTIQHYTIKQPTINKLNEIKRQKNRRTEDKTNFKN